MHSPTALFHRALFVALVCGLVPLWGAHWTLASVRSAPLSHQALATSLPPIVVGANVDIDTLLPRATEYVSTPQGDLFNIARANGLNAFRVTAVDKGTPPNGIVASDWSYIGQRALTTHIALIPLLTAGGYVALQRDYPLSSSAELTATALIKQADMILGQAGLARSGAVPVVDISNEHAPSTMAVDILRRVTDHIHATYPGVEVTVGGWAAPAGPTPPNTWQAPKNAGWVYNYPSDGASFAALDDVVSVHIYAAALPNHRVPRLETFSPAQQSQAVVAYLQTVNAWAGGKPILVEEFGSVSDLLPGAQNIPTPMTPALQSSLITAVLHGVVLARQQGINVIGGLAWILAPRGGTADYGGPDSAYGLIIPQGYGASTQPLTYLPGLAALCPGLEGLVPCSSVATAAATNTPLPTSTAMPTSTSTPTAMPTSTSTATPRPMSTATATATATPPVLPTATSTSTSPSLVVTLTHASTSPSTITPGTTATFAATLTANRTTENKAVVFEVDNASGAQVWQTRQSPVAFTQDVPQTFTARYTIPATLPAGRYTLNVGLYTLAGVQRAWYDRVTTFIVSTP